MTYRLTEKLERLTPYEPVAGEYSVRLDANESFIALPPAIRAEIAEALQTLAFNRYPDPCAQELLRAYGEYYGLDPRLLTAGNGSDELISVLMNSFFARGEKVLVASPDFSMYEFYIHLAELTPVVLPKAGAELNADELLALAKREGVRGIIFSNPCNPTARGLTAADIRKLIRGTDALVILDEAYMDFWQQSLLGEVADYDNLIILRTCSKMLGLAALRLGFAVANERLTTALRAAKSPYNIGTLAQTAGTIVLRHHEYLDECRARLLAARDELYTGLCALPLEVEPTHTNFVLVKAADNRAVYQALAARGIAVRLLGNYLRISAGAPAENRALLSALAEILA